MSASTHLDLSAADTCPLAHILDGLDVILLARRGRGGAGLPVCSTCERIGALVTLGGRDVRMCDGLGVADGIGKIVVLLGVIEELLLRTASARTGEAGKQCTTYLVDVLEADVAGLGVEFPDDEDEAVRQDGEE